MNCCPGGKTYAMLTFSNSDMSTFFTAADEAVFRTGARGISTLVTIVAVDGDTVSIEATDGTTLIECCTGSPDDYGFRGELINMTTATATSSDIMAAECDSATDTLFLELFHPIIASTNGDAGTITLENGSVISVVTSADAGGVFLQVQAAPGETCDLCGDLVCNCLVNAVFALTI